MCTILRRKLTRTFVFLEMGVFSKAVEFQPNPRFLALILQICGVKWTIK